MYIQLMDNNEDTNVYDMLMWRVSLVFSKTCQRCAKNDALIYTHLIIMKPIFSQKKSFNIQTIIH